MGGKKNKLKMKQVWRRKDPSPSSSAAPVKQVWRRKDPSSSTSAPPPPPPPPPPWIELPRDITANILQRLGVVDILDSAQKVCKTWRSVCLDPAMWRVIDMSDYDGDYDDDDDDDASFNKEIMVRHAVDRSQGQLVDISIGCFGTDELLEFIAERSDKLKRLQLVFCNGISSDSLNEAVKRFPLLEELHLYFTSIPSESIEVLGRSCPLLKSFTLDKRGFRHPQVECNKEALAVARTMPELRQLHLFGNNMTNEGLQAILDCCKHLESLDLRRCFNVNLGGDLGKRCLKQIKYLRRPGDSTADYKFDAEVYDSDSFDGYPSGFSDLDLVSDFDEYLDYDDYTLWDVDPDYEDFLGALLMDGCY